MIDVLANFVSLLWVGFNDANFHPIYAATWELAVVLLVVSIVLYNFQGRRLRNYAVTVKEWNDEIIFVRQVTRGAADRSYGIQVARLAGLPREVIVRAQEILAELESEGQALQAQVRRSLASATTDPAATDLAASATLSGG